MTHAYLDVVLTIFFLLDLSTHKINMQIYGKIFLLGTFAIFNRDLISNRSNIDGKY
jgi:hypothetical protein